MSAHDDAARVGVCATDGHESWCGACVHESCLDDPACEMRDIREDVCGCGFRAGGDVLHSWSCKDVSVTDPCWHCKRTLHRRCEVQGRTRLSPADTSARRIRGYWGEWGDIDFDRVHYVCRDCSALCGTCRTCNKTVNFEEDGLGNDDWICVPGDAGDYECVECVRTQQFTYSDEGSEGVEEGTRERERARAIERER